MTDEEKKAFDALIDDTDVAMSIDGERASYHTKRLASVLHSVKNELTALRARCDRLERVAEAVEKYKSCAHLIQTEQAAHTNRTTVECATFIWDELCAALAEVKG